jgi:hypothetical protein
MLSISIVPVKMKRHRIARRNISSKPKPAGHDGNTLLKLFLSRNFESAKNQVMLFVALRKK